MKGDRVMLDISTSYQSVHRDRHPVRGRRRRPGRRRFRDLAALRAVTAAKLFATGSLPSMVAAAEACGSNPAYVRAAIVLLKSENSVLIDRVLRGHVPLLTAAKEVRRLAEAVHTFRQLTLADRPVFTRIIGPGELFDTTVSPAV
jgi:hypothetical protein